MKSVVFVSARYLGSFHLLNYHALIDPMTRPLLPKTTQAAFSFSEHWDFCFHFDPFGYHVEC